VVKNVCDAEAESVWLGWMFVWKVAEGKSAGLFVEVLAEAGTCLPQCGVMISGTTLVSHAHVQAQPGNYSPFAPVA
jgi:hypothetical protein